MIGPSVDLAFLSLVKSIQEVRLRPEIAHAVGVYTGALIQFYFVEFPEITFDVPITATILPCRT